MKPEVLARRFLLRNPDGLTDGELLELLLQYCGEGARSRAEALMETYQSIAAVLEAPIGDLATVPELSQQDILLIRLVAELHRRYFLSRSLQETRLRTGVDFGNYLVPFFHGARDELLQLLCMDAAGRVLTCKTICTGSVDATSVPFRRIAQEALQANASAVVLAHNHPSGIAVPSDEDVEVTLRLKDALHPLGILLADHVIVADSDFVSFRDSGFLRKY